MADAAGVEPATAWFVARYSIQLSYASAMAEREGFEPSIGYKAYTPLAGERLRPLGHLSSVVRILMDLKNKSNTFLSFLLSFSLFAEKTARTCIFQPKRYKNRRFYPIKLVWSFGKTNSDNGPLVAKLSHSCLSTADYRPQSSTNSQIKEIFRSIR